MQTTRAPTSLTIAATALLVPLALSLAGCLDVLDHRCVDHDDLADYVEDVADDGDIDPSCRRASASPRATVSR